MPDGDDADLIRRLCPGATAEQSWINPLGGRTYRMSASTGVSYLKLADESVPSSHDLTVEAERLRWVGDRFPVPQVIDSGRIDGHSWLISAELPGTRASDPRWSADPVRTATTLGRTIRAFHDALADRTAECPWSWRIADRVRGGTGSAEARAMLSAAPPERDLVVRHGDLCAPNILLHADGRGAGIVDLGKLGVADRAADLGCHLWSLQFNDMADQIDVFLAAYGFSGDPAELWWYRDFYTVV